MKTLITLLLLLLTSASIAQGLKFGEKESFVYSIYGDVNASFKEHGLDIGTDIEYRGPIFAKLGIESFSALPGKYFDIHGAFGPRFTLGYEEEHSIYLGFRGGFASRNGATNPIAGFEGGYDYTFNSGLLLGANASYIYRGDMKAMQWPEVWRPNVYVRVGYSWDWKQ